MTRRPPGYNEMLTEFGTYINETYEKNISDAYQMMTIEEITNKHLYNYILYNYYNLNRYIGKARYKYSIIYV